MTSMRLMLEWAILLALAIAGAAFLHASGATDRVDNQILDAATALSRPAPLDEIAIVEIDDRSLAQKGTWPWSRDLHAQLVERLDEAGARLIILDVLFLDPTDDDADDALANAIRASGKVILPHTFGPRPNTQFEQDPVLPLPELASAALAVGHVAVETDSDGVLRRFELGYPIGEKIYPHLSVVAMKQLGRPVDPDLEETPRVVPFQDRFAFQKFSAGDILDGSTPDGFLEDKIVLVGATAQGMGDRYSVASGDVGLMPGVEAQASLLNALMQDALITPVAPIWQNLLAGAALLLLFLAFWHLPPRYVLICAVAVIVMVTGLSLALLGFARLWLAPASIVIVIMLAYPLWSWRRLSHASRYLDREAARLTGGRANAEESSGLDYVTQRIEQLRRLVRTVHDSLSFLRRVIEAAPDAIIVLDRNEAVQMLNAKASQLFPDWEELENATFGEFLRFAEAELSADGSELETGDGRTFLIARAELEDVDQQERAGSIIALREVTELRRLDQERRQMLEFLSHDMRTPQVAIVGLTHQGDAPDPNTNARIRSQAERTLKLADDFVQLARLEGVQAQFEDTDIGGQVEEACDRAYSLAKAKRITIDRDVPESPRFASVDASLLARMLDNLISNAIKYSDAGSTVSVMLQSIGEDRIRIAVCDNGPGLPPGRMADPFARFGSRSSDAGSGADPKTGPSAGLGLAFVKRAVEVHDGTIDVKTAPGEGTAFVIELPIDAG